MSQQFTHLKSRVKIEKWWLSFFCWRKKRMFGIWEEIWLFFLLSFKARANFKKFLRNFVLKFHSFLEFYIALYQREWNIMELVNLCMHRCPVWDLGIGPKHDTEPEANLYLMDISPPNNLEQNSFISPYQAFQKEHASLNSRLTFLLKSILKIITSVISPCIISWPEIAFLEF